MKTEEQSEGVKGTYLLVMFHSCRCMVKDYTVLRKEVKAYDKKHAFFIFRKILKNEYPKLCCSNLDIHDKVRELHISESYHGMKSGTGNCGIIIQIEAVE